MSNLILQQLVEAATRGSSCLKNKQEITALLPANKSGLTLNEHPTFFGIYPRSPSQLPNLLSSMMQKKK
jgi:hypothetical protein|nr:DUF928 domain-containing protein [Trichormus azollae]